MVRKLREEDLFRDIFEFCPDGLFLVDGNGVIQAMNLAMEVMTGWRREEVVGKAQCLLLFACRQAEGGAICETTCPGRSAIADPASTPQRDLQIRTKEGAELLVSARYGFLPIDSNASPSGCAIGVLREIPKANSSGKEAAIQAITDPLTGFYNLRYLIHRLQAEAKRAVRKKEPLSLMRIEIDEIERYDSRQREAILMTLAALIHEQTRETDLVAGYGGAVFVVLLPEMERQGAVKIAERLRIAVAETGFPNRSEPPGNPFTVRIAVVGYPWDTEEAEELLSLAAALLQQAKGLGRNKVHWKRL